MNNPQYMDAVNKIFQGTKWAPTDSSAPGGVGEGEYSRTGFADTHRALVGGGAVGTSWDNINADTPLGHYFRTMLDQGLIEAVTLKDTIGADAIARHAALGNVLDPNALQIRYKGPMLDDSTPGVTMQPPSVPRDPGYAAPPTTTNTPGAPSAPGGGIDDSLRATYENMLNTSHLDPGTRAAIERELGR